jgi:hypothetical protein
MPRFFRWLNCITIDSQTFCRRWPSIDRIAIESVIALPAYQAARAGSQAPAIARLPLAARTASFFGYDFHLDRGWPAG